MGHAVWLATCIQNSLIVSAASCVTHKSSAYVFLLSVCAFAQVTITLGPRTL